jgi:hypothetical protein
MVFESMIFSHEQQIKGNWNLEPVREATVAKRTYFKLDILITSISFVAFPSKSDM